DVWADGLVVRGGKLSVLGFANGPTESKLILIEGSAPSGAPQLKRPRALARFSGRVAAAGVTLAPANPRILVAAGQPEDGPPRRRTWWVGAGTIEASRASAIAGISKPLAVAVGWSSNGDVRVSVLGLDARDRTVVAEVHLRPDLSEKRPSSLDPI